MTWREDANCRGDTHPRWLGKEVTVGIARVCWPCPVRHDCLFEALQREEASDPGVWGGTNEYDRRAIRKDKNNLRLVWAELQEAAR